MNSHGIILLNKRAGATSYDEIRHLKKKLGPVKIGHGGTLDKFADGLLIIFVGYMTRFNHYLLPLKKSYSAQFSFGKETDTLDPEGETVHEAPVPERNDLEAVLEDFIGTIEQIPPVYSAVHVNGSRAYRQTRAGHSVEMPSRKVTVYSLEMKGWNPPDAQFSIVCSKGTYVRSLARDIALTCGSRAYVSGLTRTAVGRFSLQDAVSSETFNPESDIIPPRQALSTAYPVSRAVVDEPFCRNVRNGVLPKPEWMEISEKEHTQEISFLEAVDQKGRLLGWYVCEGSSLKSVFVNSGGQS